MKLCLFNKFCLLTGRFIFIYGFANMFLRCNIFNFICCLLLTFDIAQSMFIRRLQSQFEPDYSVTEMEEKKRNEVTELYKSVLDGLINVQTISESNTARLEQVSMRDNSFREHFKNILEDLKFIDAALLNITTNFDYIESI